MSNTATPDRIEKQQIFDAPLERVWDALTDSRQFGAWSGMVFDGSFVEQAPVAARPVAAVSTDRPTEDIPVEWFIERVEPMRLFSFRRQPFPTGHHGECSTEPMHTITFTVEPVADGIEVSIIESGYDTIPEELRARFYAVNDEGWDLQLKSLTEFLPPD